MSRAFIKDISGAKRMRIVKSGNDADNLSLNPNLVIFDSEAPDTMRILASGAYVVTGLIGAYTAIASWPNQGFLPIHLWSLTYSNGNSTNFLITDFNSNFVDGYVSNTNLFMLVDMAGLYPLTINYLIFNKAAF
jgi:hypothetical protein